MGDFRGFYVHVGRRSLYFHCFRHLANFEPGRTSGGFVEYTTKSGTSSFHASAYDYYNYQGLNATGEIIPQKAPERKNNWGFLVGGPVAILHVYDGRKHKTFFFADFDLLHYS
jgi:hypothetical protein